MLLLLLQDEHANKIALGTLVQQLPSRDVTLDPSSACTYLNRRVCGNLNRLGVRISMENSVVLKMPYERTENAVRPY